MKLIGRYSSPYVRRVAVTLRVYGLEYALEDLTPFGEEKADVRRYNPLGRVPALTLADGETLVESGAIIDCLDELAGPERALTPAEGALRRQVLKTVSVGVGATDKLVSSLYEHHLRPKEMAYRPWAKMCDRQAADGFQWLNGQLSGDWFVGDRMSQADVSVAVFWLFGQEKRPNFFRRLDCGNLERLAGRLAETEPFQRTAPGEGLPKGVALE